MVNGINSRIMSAGRGGELPCYASHPVLLASSRVRRSIKSNQTVDLSGAVLSSGSTVRSHRKRGMAHSPPHAPEHEHG